MKTIAIGGGLWAVLLGTVVFSASETTVKESLEMKRAYAAMGDPGGQYNLALIYHKGEGVPKDPAQAVAWYRKSAASGFALAQHNLAVLLATGDGVAKDEKEAAKWFHAAASQGHFPAQRAMIDFYARGIGVTANPVHALTWSFLARRTLELRTEQSAGEPRRPARLRPDGFAEYTTPEGRLEAVGPDGTLQKVGADGRMFLEHLDGSFTKVSESGVRETTHPDGRVVTAYPDGRTMTKDPKGTTETRWPDGRREIEGDGTTRGGIKIRVTDKFAADGTRVVRRIVDGHEAIEELPDGTRMIEVDGKDEQERVVRVIDRVDADGMVTRRRVFRDDGVERSGEEIWAITRWTRMADGKLVMVRERYGAGNSTLSAEVLAENARVAAAPAALPAKASPLSRPPASPRIPFGMLPFGIAMPDRGPPGLEMMPAGILSAPRKSIRPKVSIEAELADLNTLERKARYFAGATNADYERARAVAQRFVFNLPTTPQKAAPATRLVLRGSPPPLPGFSRLATDRSDQHPLGMHGRIAIRLHPWQHTETEHFVVHYIDPKEAYSVMGDIECTFINVVQTLQLDAGRIGGKSHVFIFPTAESWKAFKEPLGMGESIAGFAYKAELYLGVRSEREKYLETLCHEAAHAVVARFYPSRNWPLWLTEGFAEYMSIKQLELRRAAKGDTKPPSNRSWRIDLGRVLHRTGYPTGESVRLENGAAVDATALFYAESERCARALLEDLPAQSFPRFANLAFAGNPIAVCLREAYGQQCPDVAAFDAVVNRLRR